MNHLAALTILLASSAALAQPAVSNVSVDEKELADALDATSDTTAEPIGRRVDRDIPAIGKLGLKTGDTIRAINGHVPIGYIGYGVARAGTTTFIDAIHDGKPVAIRVSVTAGTSLPLTIDLDDLKLDQFIGITKAGKPSGVLVKGFVPDFESGDILRSVDGKAVTSPGELKAQLDAALAAKKDIAIVVDRLDAQLKRTAKVVDSSTSAIAADIAKSIKKIDDTHYEISRALVDQILQNPMAVAKGARVVPAMKDGKPEGFKLYAIRPGSVYAALGLSNGDTIVSLNKIALDSADKGLEAYTKIRDAKQLELAITRRGKSITITYKITK